VKTTPCTFCTENNLACSTATHDNPLARYLTLIRSTDIDPDGARHLPLRPAAPTTYVSNSVEDRLRRADRMTTIAIAVMVVSALAVGLTLSWALMYAERPTMRWQKVPAPATSPTWTPSTPPQPHPDEPDSRDVPSAAHRFVFPDQQTNRLWQ
jgi:hypothetical protein